MRLLEQEAVLDGGGGASPEPAAALQEGAPDPAAAAPEPPAPAAPTIDWNDPAVLEAIDARAAAVIDSRLASTPATEPQAPPGAPLDLNEFLSPFGDQFGENMARFLAERDQYLLSQVTERLQPVLSREEQQTITQGEQRMDELVSERWDAGRDGPLTEAVKNAVKDLAPAYLPGAIARYGEGRLAAEAATAKAADTIRAINAEARGQGAGSNADQLAALAAASREPGAGGGAITVPPPPKSWEDVRARISGYTTPTSGA